VELQPNHISAYALTLSEEVRLARRIKRGNLPELDDDIAAQKYEMADEILRSFGYEWYEISNWEKLTQNAGENRSAHNLNYWKNGEYLGVGPSAHSNFVSGDAIQRRFWNTDSVDDYEARILAGKSAVSGEEVLTAREKAVENAMLSARMNAPIKVHAKNSLEKLLAQNLVDPQTLTPTLRGRLLNDEIIRILLDDKTPQTPAKNTCAKFNTTQCLCCPQCVVS
jgi:oxygen-independent coproporphyrinogen-3 oxidase